jgi:methionine sulfoxide reductase catalytic subunit
VTVTITDWRPSTFWEVVGPPVYGFRANVNRAIAHPLWSQALKRLPGSSERVPTQIFNGYADQVAALYVSRTNEKLFM